jgi:hypothetical protein
MSPFEAIEGAELAGAEIRYRNQLAAGMYARGRELGRAEGYAGAVAGMKAVQRGLALDAGPGARRWGPGGRAHCAARAGRLPGRAVPGPEMELEAG